ncbi:MAG TPA: Ada metal-binding domain-containing protein, partial [Gemmatimonadales bacterium]|nr:Ada metal-binding domain-containing protein [Gemmatimonadales bacterium]
MTVSPKTRAAGVIEQDPRWAALAARSVAADGTFFYSVRTTGVYCRPSCGARLPRPENVRFHATREEAELAGFRPCKRCRPDRASLAEQHAATVTEICRLIETSSRVPALDALAARAGMSPFHFHRVFKGVTGLTPRAYAAAHRGERVRRELGKAPTVTAAIYDSGYSSNGRFYGESEQMLGMTPTEYRAGGARAEIRFAVGECSLGSILVARSERGVCAIFLGDDPDALTRELQDRF